MPAPHREPTQSQQAVRKDQFVLEALQGFLPALTAVLFAHFVHAWVTLDAEAATALAAISLAAGLMCGFLYWGLRRQLFDVQRSHVLAEVVWGGTLLNTLAFVGLISDTSQLFVFCLLLFGIGRTFYSLRWVFATQTAAILAWSYVCWLSLPAPVGNALVGGALAVEILSVWEIYVRRKKLSQTERKQLGREKRRRADLEEQSKTEERRQLAIEGASDGHWCWDLEADKVYFYAQWASMLGFDEKDIGNNPDQWFDRVHPSHLPELKGALAKHLYGNSDQFQCEYQILHRNGLYLWVVSRGMALRNTDGTPTAIAGAQIDITPLIKVEKKIVDDSFQDKLTGLPNRQACVVRLERCLDLLREIRGYLFAVMFLDLDRFKVVNDTFGHLIGDQLLAAVAERIQNCLRRNRGDTVGRFGGDEFVVLLEELGNRDEALEVASRITDAIAQPFQIGAHEIVTATSIGIAFGDSTTQQAEDLLRNADTAMYQAKARAQGEVQAFTHDMRNQVVRACQLSTELSKAIANEELFLHYQPMISLRTGTIVGVEALLRWRRPGGERVGPTEFIPLAEETGLIDEIGEWALRTACGQNVSWQREGISPIRISVNVSAHQLRRPTFPEKVDGILKEVGLDPQWVELEITESAFIGDVLNHGEPQVTVMRKLSESGVRLSIDDFGVGYSSLSQLRRFPFTTLKMDRSFVAGLAKDQKSGAVARGLVGLAHSLGLVVTAEGVESEKQLSFLSAEGCDYVQGYLASRPLSADKLGELLRSDFQLFDVVGFPQARADTPASIPAEPVEV